MASGRFILIAILITAPAAAQTLPTTNPQTLRKLRIDELELEAADLPKYPTTSPSDVVKFDLDNSRLVMSAPLAGKDAKARIVCSALSGMVTLTTFPVNDPRRAGQNFVLVREDLTHPDEGDISVVISQAAGRVLVSRDVESDTFLSSIELIQDPPGLPPSVPPTDPIRLFVNVEDLAQHQTLFKVQVTGKDFVDLRKHHPLMVDQYLRPIFRELHQEAVVFGIPPEVAWQILGFPGDPSDAQLDARVKSIVANLGADDFRQRQAAAAELKGIGKSAAAELMRMDRSKLSAEQNAAIDSFLADASPLGADEAKKLAGDRSILLDILFSDDRALRHKALERLSEIEGRKIELEGEFDPTVRAEAVNKLRDQLIPNSMPSSNGDHSDQK